MTSQTPSTDHDASVPHTHGGTDAPECTPFGVRCRPQPPNESASPYVVNPEAIGNPELTPILQHSVTGCPAHCEDWLYAAVRNNRRLSGLPPQDCTCVIPPGNGGAS